MIFRIILLGQLLLPCTSIAQTILNAIIDQAGQYVAASDMNEKLNLSKCGPYIERKNPLTTKLAISQVLDRLPQKEKIEAEAYFISSNFKNKLAEHQIILDKIISDSSRKRNLDFACGLAIGLTLAKNEIVFNAWSSIK